MPPQPPSAHFRSPAPAFETTIVEPTAVYCTNGARVYVIRLDIDLKKKKGTDTAPKAADRVRHHLGHRQHRQNRLVVLLLLPLFLFVVFVCRNRASRADSQNALAVALNMNVDLDMNMDIGILI